MTERKNVDTGVAVTADRIMWAPRVVLSLDAIGPIAENLVCMLPHIKPVIFYGLHSLVLRSNDRAEH